MIAIVFYRQYERVFIFLHSVLFHGNNCIWLITYGLVWNIFIVYMLSSKRRFLLILHKFLCNYLSFIFNKYDLKTKQPSGVALFVTLVGFTLLFPLQSLLFHECNLLPDETPTWQAN